VAETLRIEFYFGNLLIVIQFKARELEPLLGEVVLAEVDSFRSGCQNRLELFLSRFRDF
jgi:hypothetical protein